MADRLLAYSAYQDEGDGAIVFARDRHHACVKAARLFGDEEIDRKEVYRELWADRYAPGPVPEEAYVANGWTIG